MLNVAFEVRTNMRQMTLEMTTNMRQMTFEVITNMRQRTFELTREMRQFLRAEPKKFSMSLDAKCEQVGSRIRR